MTYDAELGPATGELRAWLDLALARGLVVNYISGGNPTPRYVLHDNKTCMSSIIHDVDGVKQCFAQLDNPNSRFPAAMARGIKYATATATNTLKKTFDGS